MTHRHRAACLCAIWCALLAACQQRQPHSTPVPDSTSISLAADSMTDSAELPLEELPRLTDTERLLDSLGYIDVSTIHPDIRVSLMYARADNFTGTVLYEDLHRAYVHPQAVEPLRKAQELLSSQYPGHHLLVFDAARPMHIQAIMWSKVAGTTQRNYVSNPAHGGGMHNYGLAVDVSLCNDSGDTLAMGSKVDHFGIESHTDAEEQLARQGILSAEALANRRLLRQVMRQAGWRTLNTEWWHFNLVSRDVARASYPVIP